MALYLKVRDNRWQFSFGSKYMVIADVLAQTGDVYVTGGSPINISVDPQVKASRAPWFATFVSNLGWTAVYIPSDAAVSVPPSTVLANSNAGTLKIFAGDTELTGGSSLAGLTPGNLQGLFIFQGME